MNDLDEQKPASLVDRALGTVMDYPIISMLIGLSAIGYVCGTYVYPPPPNLVFGGFEDGQYWRLITPIFLHFGPLHFIFNALWLGLLGSKIERAAGSIQIFLLIISVAVVSNVGQYQWVGSERFGGMSGVIYGLLGYLWMHHWQAPKQIYAIPRELLGFMLVWLLIGMTGVLNFMLGVGIANAAHLCGLLAGMALGFIFGFVESRRTHHT